MIKQFLFFGLVCFGIIQGYNHFTDGYSLSQMRSQIPSDPKFASPDLSIEQEDQLRHMLDQPFRYLGKGCQFYAFGSADGNYVIKFLKQKHLRQLTPFHKISNEQRKERVEKLFSSVQLAYEKMPMECGLLYIHLNREPALGMKLTLIDKVGVKRTIAVDDYEFVLQERALDPKEVFASIASDEEAQLRIDQMVALVQARCAKGIRDRDRSFVQNVAFCKHEDRAIYVDIGQMYEDESILDAKEVESDLKRRLGNLNHFLEKHGFAFTHLLQN